MENNIDINKMMEMLSKMDKSELEKGFAKASEILNNNETNNEGSSSIDMETMAKMKNIMDSMKNSGNDPRANLLESLKPYLKDSRKDKVDQYVKMLNVSKAVELFNNMGGDTKK